jgi:hypothetical protein
MLEKMNFIFAVCLGGGQLLVSIYPSSILQRVELIRDDTNLVILLPLLEFRLVLLVLRHQVINQPFQLPKLAFSSQVESGKGTPVCVSSRAGRTWPTVLSTNTPPTILKHFRSDSIDLRLQGLSDSGSQSGVKTSG